MACKGLDEQVVRQDSELEDLQRQFVCVRVVQMKGVDLSLFQFDYDQTWAVFFMNSDRTIYGRYGTRAGNKASATTHISLAGFKKAIRRALDLHRAYPANRSELVGKTGPRPDYRRAEMIPTLAEKARGPTTPKNCIHCHMVTAHVRKDRYRKRQLSRADIWIYPLPENIGLKMDVEDDTIVKKVALASPARKAGIRGGDKLLTLGGQTIISQADLQWVLHRTPESARLPATLERDGKNFEIALTLEGNWKETNLSWRETSWSLRPGIWTVPLDEKKRKQKGIAPDLLALRIKWVFPRARLAKKAGLRDGDIILAVDGDTTPRNESEFMEYVRLRHPPGDKVKLAILRGTERRDVEMEVE